MSIPIAIPVERFDLNPKSEVWKSCSSSSSSSKSGLFAPRKAAHFPANCFVRLVRLTSEILSDEGRRRARETTFQTSEFSLKYSQQHGVALRNPVASPDDGLRLPLPAGSNRAQSRSHYKCQTPYRHCFAETAEAFPAKRLWHAQLRYGDERV